ncbi:hypothetical protein FRC06_007588 [Ceratobasidium sp. 370]|nr:hypothetical protein FRC06_007588 [Ceratobasidium sp. 370]
MATQYRLAQPEPSRAWSTQKMAQALDDAKDEHEFWSVLAANHEITKHGDKEELSLPNPPVYNPKTWNKSEKRLPLHRVHSDEDGFGVDGVDVFIAGSGPIGATYARKLVNAGLSVVMCEMGATDTKPAASHKKNEIEYQKDIDRFVNVIKGALSPVSIPASQAFVDTLDPASWNSDEPFVTNGKNPRQKEALNLSAQAVTRGTGGMATHWTCAVPHFLRGVERPVIDPKDANNDEKQWNELYDGAGELVYRSESEFNEVSIRHTLILETLKETPYKNPNIQTPDPKAGQGPSSIGVQDVNVSNAPPQGGRVYRPLPLAARRLTNSPRYVVQDLLADRNNPGVVGAPINFYIKAKYFVTCAGAVATPQILYNSGLNNFGGKPTAHLKKKPLLPVLGHYITEQPMAFCQVVLKKSLVDIVKDNPWNLTWWKEAYEAHQKENEQTGCKDPLPFPRFDPEPQITSPVTKERPWHTQIHPFSYGAVAATIDSRLVCDFRWFGRTQPDEKNRITFERDLTDAYGMPQASDPPTFEYKPNAESVREAHLMMTDMCEVAQRVGGYLPGSEPQFMAPGLALHLGGTTRLGHEESKSCANFRGQVRGFQNLYVAGNGVIDTPFAANPTLTSMGLAIYSAEDIANKEGDRDVQGWKEENGRETPVNGKVRDLFKRVVKRSREPWPPKTPIHA